MIADDLIPNATQKRQVESLIKVLAQIEVVNKDFQTDDATKITLSYVRTCFDGLIESFPDLSSHLATNAEVVAFPDFENAIVKIQRGNESNLNAQEKRAVSQFLKNVPDRAVSRNEERKEEPELSFIERMRLKDAQSKKQRLSSTSKYINTFIVAPTSDICEQLFSRAKNIMTPNRRRMDPSTLEDILILKLNTDLWS